MESAQVKTVLPEQFVTMAMRAQLLPCAMEAELVSAREMRLPEQTAMTALYAQALINAMAAELALAPIVRSILIVTTGMLARVPIIVMGAEVAWAV